jgi:ribosomal protein S18 acetylase RimI-like enzyme
MADVGRSPLQSAGVVIVCAADEATPEVVDAVARLVPQLSESARPPTAAALAEIVASPATTLFVARSDPGGPIIGMLTLVLVRIPTGVRASIEDVVVAEEARGKGCGDALSRAALDAASAGGARTVDLTSRPSREGANRLYQRLGFVVRDTNVYRYEIGE